MNSFYKIKYMNFSFYRGIACIIITASASSFIYYLIMIIYTRRTAASVRTLTEMSFTILQILANPSSTRRSSSSVSPTGTRLKRERQLKDVGHSTIVSNCTVLWRICVNSNQIKWVYASMTGLILNASLYILYILYIL